MRRHPITRLLVFVLSLAPFVAFAADSAAQPTLADTWRGPHAPLVAKLLRGEPVELPPLPADGSKPWTYVPRGDSGVPARIGAAYGGGDAQQAQGVADIFTALRDAFGKESGKDAHDADVAAAMTLFVAASTAVRQRIDVMSDADADRLYGLLARAFAAAPEFAKLTDADKQYMRDWFATMGGFIAASERAQRGNEKTMRQVDQFVDTAVTAALGMDARTLAPARALALAGGKAPSDADSKASLAGHWAASTTTSDGAWFKREYSLDGDGKYRFKSERWSGPLRASEFDTVEEAGTCSVAGRTLTLAPDWATLTIRDGDGKLIGGRALAKERVAYAWDLRYAAAANESQLVLRTPQPTARDGAFVDDPGLPGAYVFSRTAGIEWRY